MTLSETKRVQLVSHPRTSTTSINVGYLRCGTVSHAVARDLAITTRLGRQ